MTAYKLMRQLKNGELRSLFIGAAEDRPLGEWMPAKPIKKKGFAYRPGWHCTFKPIAPHLSKKGRVWVKVEIRGVETYNRPESQGGDWILAQWMKIQEVLDE